MAINIYKFITINIFTSFTITVKDFMQHAMNAISILRHKEKLNDLRKLNSPVVMMAMEKKFMCPTTLSEVALNVV